VPITTNVVSSIPADGKVYSIQYYVIKFVSDLWQVGVFFPGSPVSSTNKTERYNWNIVESGIKHHKLRLKVGKYGMHRRKYTQNFIYFKILKGA
jgi:hypothetical protein